MILTRELLPMQKINAFGVFHYSYIREKDGRIVPLREEKKIKAELQALGSETEKVGLEGYALPLKRKGEELAPDSKYFATVIEELKRLNITPAPIGDDAENVLTTLIHGAVREIIEQGKTATEKPGSKLVGLDRKIFEDHARRASKSKFCQELLGTHTPKLMKRMTAILETAPKEHGAKINFYKELAEALTVERSLQMYYNALKEGTQHNIMGMSHAEDLQALGLANASFVGIARIFNNEKFNNQKEAKKRIELHQKFGRLLAKLRAI